MVGTDELRLEYRELLANRAVLLYSKQCAVIGWQRNVKPITDP
jgi:hypothetical protein